MSVRDESKRRASLAVIDALDLLGMANAAVQRARNELGGEAHHLASRMSAHLNFLREVAELLAREIQNGEATPRIAVVQAQRASAPAVSSLLEPGRMRRN